jgi:hypothetical protein
MSAYGVIAASELDALKAEFKRADVRMSRGILEVYQAHWRAERDAKLAAAH